MTAPQTERLKKALHTINDAAKILSFSRAHLYREIRAGRLKTVRSGRATRISDRAINAYIQLLEQEAETR